MGLYTGENGLQSVFESCRRITKNRGSDCPPGAQSQPGKWKGRVGSAAYLGKGSLCYRGGTEFERERDARIGARARNTPRKIQRAIAAGPDAGTGSSRQGSQGG